MSLDFSKLECVKALADRTIAACPACREQGHDKKGNHLVIWPDGKFGCVSNPEDGAHRSRIFALAGEKDEKPSPARTPARRRSSWPTIEAAAAAITPPGFHLEAVYRYGNAAAVARYEPDEDGEKTFRQFSFDGSAWVTGAPLANGRSSALFQQPKTHQSSSSPRGKRRVSPLAPSDSRAFVRQAGPAPPQSPIGRPSLAEKSQSSPTTTRQEGSMRTWSRPFSPRSTPQQRQSALSCQTYQSEATLKTTSRHAQMPPPRKSLPTS